MNTARRVGIAALALTLATATTAAGPRPTRALTRTDGFSQRALVATFGDAGLRADGLTSDQRTDAVRQWPWVIAEERDDAVRLVVDSDSARLLLWVRRDDLGWTPRAPIQVRGDATVGVWLLPGAPLTVTDAGDRRAIRYQYDHVTVDADVAADQLARTYTWRRPPRPGRWIAPSIAAAPGGAPLVDLDGAVLVERRGKPRDGWVLVEHRTEQVRVLGWARVAELTRGDQGTIGTLSGYGYGITDTARLWVPRGTCLYDEDGALVGLETARRERYGYRLPDGRWSLYVQTPWGRRTIFVVDERPGAATPRLRRCKP